MRRTYLVKLVIGIIVGFVINNFISFHIATTVSSSLPLFIHLCRIADIAHGSSSPINIPTTVGERKSSTTHGMYLLHCQSSGLKRPRLFSAKSLPISLGESRRPNWSFRALPHLLHLSRREKFRFPHLYRKISFKHNLTENHCIPSHP